MPLSQVDRIAFSKAIVEVAENLAAIDLAQQTTEIAKQKAYDLDQANKRLVDAKSTLIGQYHVEINNITGQVRTELVEQDFQDGANRVLGNFLFPNNVPNTPPSIAPGPWIAIRPYARNKAIGQNYSDALNPVVGGELSTITAMLAKIAAIETNYLAIERTTGETCTDGTCSLPQYTNEIDCLANSGVWTPGVDTIGTYTAVHNALTALTADVNYYKTVLLAEQANVITDDEPSRQATNVAAIAALTAPIADVDAWLALSNFDTSHGETTCAGFFAHDPNTLNPTKLRPTELTALKNSLLTRQTAAIARSAQISSYLGTVTQSMVDGTYTGNGLYYLRWLYTNLRLNVIGGSLSNYIGLVNAVNGQNALKDSYVEQRDLYLTLLTCSAMSAPTNGTNVVHVTNPSGFVAGDNVFIKSETQSEIQRTIESVSGNKIVLGQSVPAKYRPNEFARLYKDLT